MLGLLPILLQSSGQARAGVSTNKASPLQGCQDSLDSCCQGSPRLWGIAQTTLPGEPQALPWLQTTKRSMPVLLPQPLLASWSELEALFICIRLWVTGSCSEDTSIYLLVLHCWNSPGWQPLHLLTIFHGHVSWTLHPLELMWPL